ncbi:MAG: TonB-dependent receptor [Acidobacteriia bacterium]|nr:TonB-dependent receptor [Terriglobia bacterium]
MASSGYTTRHLAWRLSVLAAVLALALPSFPQRPARDLTEATIEELMNITVTTVSKKEQTLTSAPAAVYVITQEDIRRSGVTSLPEALRLAPGVQVAQLTSSDWAVSIRGANSRFANKLLVLVDGRTVYTPSFSGVFWAEQDLLLEDIDRIEVIRGPGASLWGTNAVNGVINIITRPADETNGGFVGGGVGSWERATLFARYGGRAGDHGNYRVFIKHARRADLADTGALGVDDSWNSTRGGFRADWKLNRQADAITFEGEGYQSAPDVFAPGPSLPFPGLASSQGGNLLARWQHRLSNGSEFSARVYFDETRQSFPEVMDLRHDTLDLDFQYNARVGKKHDLVWGGNFRNIRQRTWGTPAIHFDPPARTFHIFSGFVQDEITLSPALVLTLGTKFESDTLAGVSAQPTARILFAPSTRHSFWAAISRAMRSPSELEAEAHFTLPGFPTPWGWPKYVQLLGNPDPVSEELVAYEVGYRTRPARHWLIDAALFFNRYHHLANFGLAQHMPVTPDLIPLVTTNTVSANSHGAELSATYTPWSRWKITGSYSWLHFSRERAGEFPEFSGSGDNPAHQFQIHSYLSLPGKVEFDSHLYFVDRLPTQPVPRYTRVDLRLGWRPNQHLECSLAGQNLLDSAHREFFTGIQGAPLEVRRSVFARFSWRF